MIYRKEDMGLQAMADWLSTSYGLIELVIAGLCVLAGMWVSRKVFQRWFTGQPERLEHFLPYVGYRMVLPLSAQVLVVLCSVIWVLVLGHRAHVLQVISAMLFWMTVIRVLAALLRQALPRGRFEQRTEQMVAMLCWMAFVAWAGNLDDYVLDGLQSITFRVGKTQLDLLMVLTALLWISVIVLGALSLSRAIEKRLMQLSELDENLRLVLAKLTRTLLVVSAVLIALPVLGIDLTVLSVFGGAVGVGLGLGLQKIASNYISGFIILLDRSIRIGDRLMIDNRVGYVSKITSRYVVLKGLDGSEALVPNDTLIANTVINQSYSDKKIWTSISVTVAYDTDLDMALGLLRGIARHPRIAVDPAPNAYLVNFGDSSITLELGYWVLDPENGFLGLKSELLLAIWRCFKENGITMPYPQREVRIVNAREPVVDSD
ncbi:mechanosensitive ion channel family protein [Paludibacterium paludis]|uniref:Mechanosensitive ion channel-like protein n=1 Tax=Paludibacterium paludis TaxID=1225769 RepID=A0A918P5Y7_9NEIS|nr:mechanosensitive ion channel domain-containing protein [Paludibacterium paludis]GGY28480.1 hypothetical protein GCM10011289_34680 [Paludibacterium paludis]